MLANEKAEAERSAALQQKAATPAPRETKRYFKVTVRDNATLEAGLLPAGTVVIRLEGITARSPDETCKKESGATWPCGAKARAALIQLHPLPRRDLHGAARRRDQGLRRALQRDGAGPLDLARAPRLGERRKRRSEAELAKALDAAKTEKLGLWQAE